MKMIAFLSGELGNSATLFSSFANVCNDNASEINGTFGEKANNTWHSWEYSVRLSVVKKVDVLKETLSWQKLAQHNKKSKITALIAKLKSRIRTRTTTGVVRSRRFNACTTSYMLSKT